MAGPVCEERVMRQEIVENLNSPDVAKVRIGTDDLNNLLNNTAEDAYSTFPIDQIMPALVHVTLFFQPLRVPRCLPRRSLRRADRPSYQISHGRGPRYYYPYKQ